MINFYLIKTIKYVKMCCVIGVISIISTLIYGINTNASAFSWAGGAELSVISTKEASESLHSSFYCGQPEERIVNNVRVTGLNSEGNSICMSGQERVRFGIYNYNTAVVAFNNEINMYIVNHACGSVHPYCTYLPDEDVLIARESVNNSYYGTKLVVYRNFSKRLTKVNHETLKTIYNFDNSDPDFTLLDRDNEVQSTRSFGLSPNGRWLVGDVEGKGMIRLNLETFEVKKFSDLRTNYNYMGPEFEYAVTNDGRHIAMMGTNVDATIYDIDDVCGEMLTSESTSNNYGEQLLNPCPSFQLYAYPEYTVPNFKYGYSPYFDENGGEISYFAANDVYGQSGRWVTLRASGYTAPASKLDYLALGDSFSSGEGDSMRAYLAGTDVQGNKTEGTPEERCHVSQNSYPFRLQSLMHIQTEEVKSVACGGAIISDLTSGTSYDDYTGQWDRLKSLQNIDELRNDAKRAFIPGRIQQIEFVKENKPKAITLTAGGNDLEFSGLLKSCILKQACPATNDTLKALVAKTIHNMKGQLQSSYENLQQASPRTRIYVVSYPHIASDESLFCGLNVPLLANERQYINETISYLNKTIESAAKSAGVKYVDIEQSLDGHKLCEEAKDVAVNGIYFDNFQIDAGSFHPNTKGHELMAAAIMDKIPGGLLEYDYCSELSRAACRQPIEDVSTPEYFAGSVAAHPENQRFSQFTDKGPVKRGSVIRINVNGLRKGAVAIVRLNGQNISELTVDSNGKISGTITLPDDTQVGVGIIDIHTETPSSEPIDLTQVIDIQDPNLNDTDGDGISNTNDTCQIITPSGSDVDRDGIDDACDAVIGQPPVDDELYRVRNGRPEKGENKLYMYIERNVKRSAEIGIKNDYDGDGDGWAIVAASRNEGETGVATRFWVDANKKPHITVRTAVRGCVQYTAQKLTRVTNKPAERKIIREASFADNCRPEEPGADVDKNNVADNVQQLYRAYNGDPAKGQDPTRVYLDRNLHAAEAQLGISDYAPIDDQLKPQPWNRLAGALTNKTKGTFSALVMTNKMINGKNTPFPVILLRDKANRCFAVEPQSVDTIIKSQQQKKTLVPVAIPAGHSCL